MTLKRQKILPNGLIEPDFTVAPQAAFVLETIGRPPDFQENRKFKFTAANRNMPMRPWSFGTEVVTSRSDYPGSVHSPTEQILTVKFKDFTLNGKLKDSWNYPGYAVEAWRGLELISTYGQMVRCSYRSVYADGVIKHVDFDYFHEAEIHYSITISPHNREPGKRLKSSPRTVLNSKQLLNEVVLIRDEIADAHSNAPRFFVAGLLWSEVDNIAIELDSTISTLDNIINQRIVLPDTEPGLALKRIAAMFRLARTNAEDLISLLESKRSDNDLTYSGAIQILRFEQWSKGVIRWAKMLVVAAERASREMLSRANPNLVALYSPKQGEHLMKIANQFYGNPLNWKRIATRNNLGSSLVLTGEELLIIPEAVARL